MLTRTKLLFCILTALLQNVLLLSNSHCLHDIVICHNRLLTRNKKTSSPLLLSCSTKIERVQKRRNKVSLVEDGPKQQESCFVSCKTLYILFVMCIYWSYEVIIIFNFVQIVFSSNETIKYYAYCFKQEKY